MSRKLTHNEFIKRSIKIHGEKYKYPEQYKGRDKKIKIICPEHGPFYQLPANHWKGHGCADCANCRKFTHEEFVEKARRIHGDKYEYPVYYIGIDIGIKINCPIHGSFLQSPYVHINMECGCPECGKISQGLSKRKDHETFLLKAKEIHGDKYKYPEFYKTIHEPITIICPEHGTFKQAPSSHINTKSGCPDCGLIQRGKSRRLGNKEFIKRSKLKHGNKYIYNQEVSLVTEPINIICTIHGEFSQTPHMHMQGQGCPKCGIIKRFISLYEKGGHDLDKEGTLYQILIFNEEECFFKVGITINSIKQRFKNLFRNFGYKIIVLETSKLPLSKLISSEQNFLFKTDLIHYILYKRHLGRIMRGGRYECFEVPSSYQKIQYGIMGSYDSLPEISSCIPDYLETQLNQLKKHKES